MGRHLGQSYGTMNGPVVFMALISITIIFISGVMAAPYLINPALATERTVELSGSIAGDEILVVYDKALTKIYEESVPSVVKIEVVRPDGEGKPETGLGSGFVWDRAGHIITNFHVIAGAEQITVTFVDGARFGAIVVDSRSSAELAVLKVDRAPNELQPVTLGDSASLKVGELTLAIGAPFGHDFTMTRGIVSAVGRTIRTCENCYPIADTIQTDTPINPGNSGGPLLNQRGEVIGINTMVVSLNESNTGISFAISSDMVRQIVPGLIGDSK